MAPMSCAKWHNANGLCEGSRRAAERGGAPPTPLHPALAEGTLETSLSETVSPSN